MSYNIIKIYLLAEADTQDLFDAVVAIESIENNAIERIEIDFERVISPFPLPIRILSSLILLLYKIR
jgi:hypothetical protein